MPLTTSIQTFWSLLCRTIHKHQKQNSTAFSAVLIFLSASATDQEEDEEAAKQDQGRQDVPEKSERKLFLSGLRLRLHLLYGGRVLAGDVYTTTRSAGSRSERLRGERNAPRRPACR